MGLTSDAYTIVGLKITENDLTIETTHKYELCGCGINSVNFNFCPSCGSKNKFGTYTTHEYINNYNDEYNDDHPEDELGLVHGILTINNTKYKVFKFEYLPHMYLSIYKTKCFDNGCGCTCEECPLSLENLCELKQKLMEDLCTIDIWKNDIDFINNFNKNFKIHTILERS